MSQSDLRNHLRNVLKKEVASLKRRQGSALLAEGRRTSSRRHSSHKRYGSALLAEGRRQSSRKHSRKGEGIISDVAGLLGLGRRQSSRKHSRKSLKGEGVMADVASLFGLGKRRRHSSKGSALIGLPNRIGSSKAKRSHRRVSHKY